MTDFVLVIPVEALSLGEGRTMHVGKATSVELLGMSASMSSVCLEFTVKWIKTSGNAVEADLGNYLATIEAANIISINAVPIASDNFGVLLVHK